MSDETLNPNRGLLNQEQILQRAFDEAQDKLRVDSSISINEIQGEVSVEIDAADGDNIALANADGSKKVTVTTIGSKEALDVNVANLDITVSTPTIVNINIPNANTEQSYIILAGTKRISAKLRGVAELKIAYNSGTSGSTYLTIPPGTEYLEDKFILTSNITLYFQTTKNNQVLEVITWS